MRACIKVPKTYCFYSAMLAIQKGKDDPLIIVSENGFKKAINLGGTVFFINIFKEKDKLYLTTTNNYMSKCTENELIKELKKLLGLDDPLFYNCSFFDDNLTKKLFFLPPVYGYLSIFESVVQTILGQLISAKVANLIRSKFVRAFGERFYHNDYECFLFPTPKIIANVSLEQIQTIGINRTKSQAIHSIGTAFHNDNLEEILKNKSNTKEIEELLMSFYGVGKWTSDWVSLRGLRKFEIIPTGDLIIKKSFSWYYNSQKILSSKEISSLCEKWHPYGGAVAYRIMGRYIKEKHSLIKKESLL